jgi:serine/threonine-protein kinase RsbW
MGDPAQVDLGELHLRLACEPASVPQARMRLQEWWRRRGMRGELPTDIQLAVTEAATNAVRHAGCDDFEMTARLTDDSVIVSVSDTGTGRVEGRRGRSLGLGLAIIRELAESVCFEHADPGTRVTMRFDRDAHGGACKAQP